MLSIAFSVYSAKRLKKRLSVSKSPETHIIKKKEYSSQLLLQSEGAHSQGRVNRGRVSGGVGLMSGGRGERTRQRFSSNEYLVGVLLESWLVCSSINSWVLYPSVPLFCKRARWRRCRCGMRLVVASCQRRLIGSSWIDPRSFPHLNCDLILQKGPSGMYLNAKYL